MKMLLSTTALVCVLGLTNIAIAQTAQPKANPNTALQQTETQGFLATRGQSDVFASDLMGHDVYARKAPASPTVTGVQPPLRQSPNLGSTMTTDGTHTMAAMSRTDLEAMHNIGKINEIVLSSDGQVRAIVIGVGGFLGLGEQDVAVTMDQVTFASDPEDRAAMYVVVNTSDDMLKTSPAYNRMGATGDQSKAPSATSTNMAARGDRAPFMAPTVKREGYDRVAITEMSAETLVGKSVYGTNDVSIGTIEDLILDDKGTITNVIIDFGGFLGIGTSRVSVGFDELAILADKGRADIRVYVDATKEQIQAQPQYRASN